MNTVMNGMTEYHATELSDVEKNNYVAPLQKFS